MRVPLFDTIKNAVSWYRDPYAFLDQRIALGKYDFRVDLPGSSGAMFVGSPDLIRTKVRSIKQMKLVNLFCRINAR